ncbi:MAG: ATP-dependent Clp protease proteolytic subunit [Solobacterium sp.]|nr:ATP-dependent Clp protease proteolytic subunit [Solobacterium sp.]
MITVQTMTRTGLTTMDLASFMLAENREIWLTGEVNDESAKEIIMQMRYLEKQGKSDITLMINSPGGNVTSGFAILDEMNRNSCDIRTVCTGMAASMAAFLFANGTKGKRLMTPLAEVMIHQPLAQTAGQASDIMCSARHIQKTKDRLNRILAEVTGKPFETVAEDTDRDYYMDAQEAVAYGLADGILQES